ncbi:Ferredoxin, partial [Dysosmobacter welbionis]
MVAIGAVQHLLQLRKLGLVGLGGVDDQMRGRLEIGNIHRRGADLPAHGGSLGAVVHGLVVLLRG